MQLSFLDWCSDLTFSDLSNSSLMGMTGRCVQTWLDGYAEMQAAGAQNTYVFSEGQDTRSTLGISAVFVEHKNMFEGQYHKNIDDLVWRFWDDGRKTMPQIAWEGHDEGDMSANAATSSFSYIGEITLMSVEEVAQLLNKSADEFTPEKFKQVYKDTWINEHETHAKIQTDTVEAALTIIEQVKDETDSTGETTSSTEPNTEDDSTDPATPIDDGSAGNGRKLASVAARFVSAGLRVFGI